MTTKILLITNTTDFLLCIDFIYWGKRNDFVTSSWQSHFFFYLCILCMPLWVAGYIWLQTFSTVVCALCKHTYLNSKCMQWLFTVYRDNGDIFKRHESKYQEVFGLFLTSCWGFVTYGWSQQYVMMSVPTVKQRVQGVRGVK